MVRRRHFMEWLPRFVENDASEELPQDVNKYTPEMWYDNLLSDYFDWYSYVSEQDLIKLFELEKQKNQNFWYKRVEFPSGMHVYVSGQTGQPEHVYPESDGEYDREEPHEWLLNIDQGERSNEYMGEYADEKFNKDFWENPAPLYHGTEDLQGVLQGGIESRDQTRGISNRWVGAAVYTSLEPHGTDSYAGDGTVIVDTQAMKRDGYMPQVEMESPIQNAGQLSSIAWQIGIQDYYPAEEYQSEGIAEDTVVIKGDVPAKYVSEFDSY